jgi:NhaP-type Na+/H+ or K+/H+ antiporter
MSKLEYAFWSFAVSAVFGGTWGGLLFWFNEILGLFVGSLFSVLAFVILINMDKQEEEQPQHNRRFNDL